MTKVPKSTATLSPRDSASRGQAALEWLVLFAACWIFAGGMPPEVGESHYLCKAKRFWDPAFCPGDLFLDSPAPHWLFYMALGWTTRFASLEAVAVIGRAIAFALLAWSWRRLSWAVFPKPWAGLLVGGLWLLGLHRFHMAGEWVVGGIEAKSFAYAALFIGLERMARGRWGEAWIATGVASAFHVLVGGWGVVATLAPRVAAGAGSQANDEKGDGIREWLGALIGAAIALIGVVPALGMDAGASETELAQGRMIYVYVRLEHHLPFHRFGVWMIGRHVAWLTLGVILWAIARRDPLERPTAWSRVSMWCFASIGIALIGVAIDQSAVFADRESLPSIASLLRFYWFRASDMAVPLLVAVAATALAVSRAERAWLLIALLLTAAGHLAWTAKEHRDWPVPRSVRPLHVAMAPSIASALPIDQVAEPTVEPPWNVPPTKPDLAATEAWWRAWRTMGVWIRGNTPADAVFLTPPGQQTFKWCAHRAEVVSWKDIPQDARSVVEWNRRVQDLLATEAAEISPETPQTERLLALAKKYNAAYVVVDRTKDATPPHRSARVYPPVLSSDSPFAVYRVFPAESPGENQTP